MVYTYMQWIQSYRQFYSKPREERLGLDNLIKKINQFRDARDWRQYHNEKDLAISISLEAAELLEVFQWCSSEEAVQNKLPQLEEELADVLIYAIMLASNLELDIDQLVLNKLAKNEQKYPVAKSKGRKEKYTEL